MRIQPLPHRRLHPDNQALPALPACARAFAVGESGARLVTLADAATALKVLVPRGHGWPMLGVRSADALRGALHGEACSPGRWAVAGAVAVEVHEVDLPRGPAPAVAPADAPGAGAWLALRLRNLPWSAARLRDPSAGHGLVAVAGLRVVVGVSPAGRDAGVSRGMSLRLARRHCPRLKFVAPAATRELADAVSTWILSRFPQARPGRTWLIPVAAHPTTAGAVTQADTLCRHLWQLFGVECTVGVAADPEAARAVTRWLGPRQLGIVPADADEAVVAAGRQRRRAIPRGHRWEGAPRPDVEGVAEIVRTLAAGLPAGRRVVVHLETERGPVAVRVHPQARLAVFAVERAVRAALLGVGSVSRIHIQPGKATPPAPAGAGGVAAAPLRQLALIPGLR